MKVATYIWDNHIIFLIIFLLSVSEDYTKKYLQVDLMKMKKSYVSDYGKVGLPNPGEDDRPVGVPDVFFPLDTRGELLQRQVIT
jgi:hypothetical protein